MSNLKAYVKPVVSIIELKTEERLAGSLCSCSGTDNNGQIYRDSSWHS